MADFLLLTNDDGIDSDFFHALVEALRQIAPLVIAAPTAEQSWVGRGVSRRKDVSVSARDDFGCPAWAIDGSPTDCVNIAMGNLLRESPRAIVSGINIGYNTTTPLIYSSGTVAAAMEGAFWSLPAFAVSQAIPRERFDEVRQPDRPPPDDIRAVVRQNARHAASFIKRLLHEPPASDAVVHNLNYPFQPRLPHEVHLTTPAQLRRMPLYTEIAPGTYRFRYQPGEPLQSNSLTDRGAIAQGWVSHTVLNFSRLAGDLDSNQSIEVPSSP